MTIREATLPDSKVLAKLAHATTRHTFSTLGKPAKRVDDCSRLVTPWARIQH